MHRTKLFGFGHGENSRGPSRGAALRTVAVISLAAATVTFAAFVISHDTARSAAAVREAQVQPQAQAQTQQPGQQDGAQQAAAQEAARLAARPVVAFLGDSLTAGNQIGGQGDASWANLVSHDLDWNAAMFAVSGTGFVNPGTAQDSFLQRVGKVVAAHPDVVVVAGGQNDRAYSVAAIVKAVHATLTELKVGLPNARIVLAPLFNGRSAANILTLHDDLRALATQLGVTFIDTTADQWLSGPQAKLLGSDGISPTDAGHAAIARLAEPRFRALGIPRRQA